MTEARDPDKLTRIARMELREIEEEFVSLADMQRRIDQGFRILGAGRAGGGLTAGNDAAVRAGRAVARN